MPTVSLDRLRNAWQNTQSSLWFLPTVLVAVSIVLSYALPAIDTHLPRQIAIHRGWLFYGSPAAARTLLSTIAGSLITVISLLFSITMLTLQQASTQYTSRVLRNFTDDRGVQWVLATYIGTFVYCLLIMRRVRSATSQTADFVPVLSITVAIILALICVALLVYYVHHVAMLLQAGTVIERVHGALLSAIESNFPDKLSDQETRQDESQQVSELARNRTGFQIHSESSGYLQSVDEKSILDAIGPGGRAISELGVGQYVLTGTVLIETANPIEDKIRIRRLRDSFILGRERSMADDTLFGVRQLVDIALRALSPGINDPTTAEHVLACLSDALVQLGGRAFPMRLSRKDHDDGQPSEFLWLNRPSFSDYVEASYMQIARAAQDDVSVTRYLLTMLHLVARRLHPDRARPVWEQVGRVLPLIEHSNFTPDDKRLLLAIANSDEMATLHLGRFRAES